ncbi:putative membrane protein [Halapricum desulfuricans]|uniref:Putative membrane protein n=1 Tax=Halapricum desulfuricans TaxID=2841257 RepID=A0A897NM20_9EURY|nr:hypothetical protein [Halapricum desulfuricans]QSG12515.1 putative membrane protein [Halapricum desulfuricans]
MIDQRPTRFSTVIAVAVPVAATAALVRAVGLERQTAYAAIGAVALAIVLGLLATERLRPVGAALVGPVFPVVALAVIAGGGIALVGQLRNALPIGSAFVVGGAALTAFGAVLAVRDSLSRDVLARAVASGLRATAVVGLAMAVALSIRFAPVRSEAATALEGLAGWVFEPTAAFPLASFLTLSIAVLYLTRATVRALPLAALLGDRLADARETLKQADRTLKLSIMALVATALGALLLEVTAPDPYAWVPDGVEGVLGTLTGSTQLRQLLVAVLVVDGLLLASATSLKRAYRGSGRAALLAVVPYFGGGVVVAAVVRYREPFVSTLVEQVLNRLPAQLASPFDALVSRLVAVYGEAALALMIVTALSGLTLVVLLALFVSSALGLLADRAGGVALAASGTVLTTAFAATIGVDLRLALAGAVGAFIAWDVGSFGAGLGSELGARASTARIELVHGGATVLVGIGAVGMTIAADRSLESVGVSETLAVPALVAATVGLLLLVIASR